MQTETEEMGKDIPSKYKRKENWGSNTHQKKKKKDFKTKIAEVTKILHNDQGINSGRRCNNCKCIGIWQRSTSIHKANINRHKRRD